MKFLREYRFSKKIMEPNSSPTSTKTVSLRSSRKAHCSHKVAKSNQAQPQSGRKQTKAIELFSLVFSIDYSKPPQKPVARIKPKKPRGGSPSPPPKSSPGSPSSFRNFSIALFKANMEQTLQSCVEIMCRVDDVSYNSSD